VLSILNELTLLKELYNFVKIMCLGKKLNNNNNETQNQTLQSLPEPGIDPVPLAHKADALPLDHRVNREYYCQAI